jgi:methylated-DNA-[protein]-cysteine S-methyltransferase
MNISSKKSYRNHCAMVSFKERVYAIVAKIPRGKTMTYKEVARRAGSPNAYRAVGNIMNKNPDTKKIPCHRVVRSDGDTGGYAHGRLAKIAILKSEGVISEAWRK